MGWHLMDSEGAVAPDLPQMVYMIDSENDLQTDPPDLPNIGSIAYLAGFTKMWQLNGSREWVRIGGDE